MSKRQNDKRTQQQSYIILLRIQEICMKLLMINILQTQSLRLRLRLRRIHPPIVRQSDACHIRYNLQQTLSFFLPFYLSTFLPSPWAEGFSIYAADRRWLAARHGHTIAHMSANVNSFFKKISHTDLNVSREKFFLTFLQKGLDILELVCYTIIRKEVWTLSRRKKSGNKANHESRINLAAAILNLVAAILTVIGKLAE